MWSDYFYPRSPCGERPINKLYDHLRDKISIHALLAESDGIQSGAQQATAISIHALLAESDLRRPNSQSSRPRFLSTLSLRRATNAGNWVLAIAAFLSTLSLRRATPEIGFVSFGQTISIHALLAESDHYLAAKGG